MSCRSNAAQLACKYGTRFIHYRVGKTSAPDYTVQDHAPKRIDTHNLIVKPTSPKDSEIKIANVEFFVVWGNVSDIKQGDILVADFDDATITPITIYQTSEKLSGKVFGYKTDRICNISFKADDDAESIYKNVKFAFLPSSDYAGSPLQRELKEQLGTPSIEVITFTKKLYFDNMDAENLFLIQTDCTPNLRWTIQSIVQHGPAQILTLKRDW
jgi:hypothetical protein